MFRKFEEYLAESNHPIFESNISGNAGKAAEVFMKFINKKTRLEFKQFPFVDEFTSDSNERITGYKFYSDKNGTQMRVNNSNIGAGLIHSIDIWITSTNEENPDYNISSPGNIPLMSLLNDIASLVKKPAQLKKELAITESAGVDINEAVKLNLDDKQQKNVRKMLNAGKNAKETAAALGLPYKQILAVKKGQKSKNVSSGSDTAEDNNERTLEDKVLYHNELMQDVYDITSAIAQGKFNSLFISGRAGTGKTFNVEKALDEQGLQLDRDYFKVTGSISVVELFRKLFQFRNKILVFDDADSVFGNEDGRNILKAALDSKPVRRISYFKKIKSLYDPKDFEDNPEGEVDAIEAGMIPQTFDFTGRVIFISNLPKKKADPDGAIRSRSILVDVNPDDETLVGVMEKLLPHLEPKELTVEEKKEVFEFVKSSQDVSMRTFVKAAGFKTAGMKNWKRMADRYI